MFISGVDEREFDVIHAQGMQAHVWMWTTNRGDRWIRDNHPEWYMVSRTGKSCFDQPPYVDYYRWVSPVIPGVQEYIRDKVAGFAANPCVDGVHLDYVRYPDVQLARGLWERYGLDQTEEMPDYDFDYSEPMCQAFMAATGRDPREIENPSQDQEWIHFRHDQVTKLVKLLVKEAHSHGKPISAAVFPTPQRARRICRQDWDKWPLDAFCPMLYHSYYLEEVEWVGECVVENIQAVRQPIVAGLYMPAMRTEEEFRSALRLVRKRGSGGVSLFGRVSESMWKVFESEYSAHKQTPA